MDKKKRDNFFYQNFKSINKAKLIDLVKKKIPQIKKDHIYDVVHLFFEQMQKDLLKDKTIEIGNFVKFSLNRMPEKRGRNYYTGEITTTKPFNKIQISINSKLSKKLMKYFNVDSCKKEEEK